MRVYTHEGWAHRWWVSTTFLTLKNSNSIQIFLVLLDGGSNLGSLGLKSDTLPIEHTPSSPQFQFNLTEFPKTTHLPESWQQHWCQVRWSFLFPGKLYWPPAFAWHCATCPSWAQCPGSRCCCSTVALACTVSTCTRQLCTQGKTHRNTLTADVLTIVCMERKMV